MTDSGALCRFVVSLDLEGSTFLKRSFQLWASCLYRFFHDADALSELANLNPRSHPFKKWKSIGDEVVFMSDVRKPQDAVIAVDYMKSIVRNLDIGTSGYIDSLSKALLDPKNGPVPEELQELLNKGETGAAPLAKDLLPQLRVKGTAWLSIMRPYAGGMVNSTDLDLELVEFNEIVGPHMDQGFRLSQEARRACLTISPELAVIICRCEPKLMESIWLRDHPARLKGISEKSGFPVLQLISVENDTPGEPSDEWAAFLQVMTAGYTRLDGLGLDWLEEKVLEVGIPSTLKFFEG